jgi:hypothetical protein
LAARQALEVGREQHVAGLQLRHYLLESWPIAQSSAGDPLVCEIRCYRPTTRSCVLVAALLAMNIGII